jgi:hypothetical protein
MNETRSPSPDKPADKPTTAPRDATSAPDEKPARGFPGSFDQPESHPETMPREGGPRPDQTADVPLGTHGAGLPMGARGHNSPPVQKKEGQKKPDR